MCYVNFLFENGDKVASNLSANLIKTFQQQSEVLCIAKYILSNRGNLDREGMSLRRSILYCITVLDSSLSGMVAQAN